MKWIKDNLAIIGIGIVAILVFFRELIFDLLIGSARKISKETEEKAVKHRLEAELAEAKANDDLKKVKEIEEKINNIQSDLDWHKKRED